MNIYESKLWNFIRVEKPPEAQKISEWMDEWMRKVHGIYKTVSSKPILTQF